MATIQEPFEALLKWLDPDDREAAGRAYEVIRSGLIQMSVCQGFSNAEDLADEAIKRVTKRVLEIAPTYEGEPARYFHGVLRNVIKEQRLKKEVTTDEFPVQLVETEKTSNAYDCLLSCLTLLSDKKCEFILDYYTYQGREKIRSHSQMAHELGISENALRLQAYHIRQKLEKCVKQCLSRPEIKSIRSSIESESGQRKTEPRA